MKKKTSIFLEKLTGYELWDCFEQWKVSMQLFMNRGGLYVVGVLNV